MERDIIFYEIYINIEIISSNVNEVIRAVLFCFFYKKTSHAQKAQNAYKQTKTENAVF